MLEEMVVVRSRCRAVTFEVLVLFLVCCKYFVKLNYFYIGFPIHSLKTDGILCFTDVWRY